jgi:hypothetical protein
MRGKRTREEVGHDKRQRHNKRWTDGGAAGREGAEDKKQHNNQLGQTRDKRHESKDGDLAE